MSTGTGSTRSIVSFIEHLRTRGQGHAALESAGGEEVVQPAEATSPVQPDSVYEALRKINEKYLGNKPELNDLARKIVEKGGEGLRMFEQGDESALGQRPQAVAGLEAIVRLDGSRPSFIIRNGEIDLESSPVGSWGDRLAVSKSDIQQAIARVGRIDVPGSSAGFQGTGFLIGPDVILTNRHVLQVSAEERDSGEWEFIDGAAIDFGRELNGRSSVGRRKLKRLLFCGSEEINFYKINHSILDLALIELEPATDTSAGSPEGFVLTNSDEWARPDSVIFTIGYPGSPPSTLYPPSLLEQLFQVTYGYKRIAPGTLIPSQSAVSPWTLAHDATTLGGNSGSCIILAGKEGVAAGLHYGGRGTEPRENWGHVLADVLDETDGRSSETLREILKDHGVKFDSEAESPRRPPQPVKDPVKAISPGDTTGAGGSGPIRIATSPGGASFNLPIHITVTVGTPVPMSGSAMFPVSAAAGGDVEKVPVIFPDLERRKGYDPEYLKLSVPVPLPELTREGTAVAARLEDGTHELKYHKFSVVMHKRRRLALFTAANVDWRPAMREINGKKPTRKLLNGFTGNEREDWVVDPRIPLNCQLPDYFYTNDRGNFDRGHLVRRDDVAWGRTFDDMQKGNGDTYHMTNCSPQTAGFNQAADQNWGALENMLQKETTSEKICLFSGPVLASSDGFFEGLLKSGTKLRVQIPAQFWKIVVFEDDGEPAAYGFLLDQDLTDVPLTELVVPESWKRFLKPIADIERLLGGWVKLTKLKKWDRFDE